MNRQFQGRALPHLALLGALCLLALALFTSRAWGSSYAPYWIHFENIVKSSETSLQSGETYYLSPTGNDAHSGTAEAEAWSTFNHAWNYLYPGDSLVLLDGVYHQRLNPNKRDGEPGKPITIRARNDGKAIIDGDTNGDGVGDLPKPLQLGDAWPGPVGDYFVVEGIVVRNGGRDSGDPTSFGYKVGATVSIPGHNNVLRRVSAYNAHPDINSAVIGVTGSNNLLEDCVAAGSGRKMLYTFGGAASNNVFRRCFAAWQEWRGRELDSGHWPWGDTIEFYHGVNNIIENSIAYGMAPSNGINTQSQGSTTAGNKVLGSMAIGIGMKWNGTPMTWPCPPPPGTLSNTCNDLGGWYGQRKGFGLVTNSSGFINDTLVQDLFVWGNAGTGVSAIGSGSNNRLIRVTAVNNGIGTPTPREAREGGANAFNLAAYSAVQDSWIEGTQYQGGGARLQQRYVNGVLTAEPLWPWPMESRIREEFAVHLSAYHSVNPELQSFSVTDTIYPVLARYGAVQ